MASTVFGMLVSFVLALAGRDKIWTPTYDGSVEVRFGRAMEHYHGKMGLTDDLVFQFNKTPSPRMKGKCASVESQTVHVGGFEPQQVVVVNWYGGNACSRAKPEAMALHESCHLRMMHHRGALSGLDDMKEDEVKQCMRWYSERWRR